MAFTLTIASHATGVTSTTNLDITIDIPADATAIFVGLAIEGLDRSPWTVVIDPGVTDEALTQLCEAYDSASTSRCFWFGKLDPTLSGSHTVRAAGTNTTTRFHGCVVAVQGGSDAAISEAETTNTGFADPTNDHPRCTHTTSSDGALVLAVAQTNANTNETPDETEIFTAQVGNDCHSAQYKLQTTQGSEEIGWTGGGATDGWSAAAISYALASGGGGSSRKSMLLLGV